MLVTGSRIVEIDQVAGRNLGDVVERQMVVEHAMARHGDELAHLELFGDGEDFAEYLPGTAPVEAAAILIDFETRVGDHVEQDAGRVAVGGLESDMLAGEPVGAEKVILLVAELVEHELFA